MTPPHFNICTLDTVMKLNGTRARPAAHQQLHALHCVDYADMPPALRAAIPHLVRECLQQAHVDDAVAIVLS